MSRQHGLISYQQAIKAGLPPQEVPVLLRRRVWVRVRRGVFADADAWAAAGDHTEKPLLRIRAAELVLQVPHHYSHDSAALLHGIPLFDAGRSMVHVTRRRAHGYADRAGIKHHLAPFGLDQADFVGGLPVLKPARTAIDLAREHGLRPGVAACDHVMRHGVSRSELYEVLDRMPCWPYKTTARSAVELADPGAENRFESAARLIVHALGRGRPQTQFGLTDGHRTVWCDIRVCRHVFEVDGMIKYQRLENGGYAAKPEDALHEEKKRQDFVTGFKLGMSRITVPDIFGPLDRLLPRLEREIADTEARFGTSIDDLAPYIVRRRPAA